MKRRFSLAPLSTAVMIAMSAFICGSSAAPLFSVPAELLSVNAAAPLKIQYACGWTYSCKDLTEEPEVKKEEIWKVPEGAVPWTGQQGYYWPGGESCSGHPCNERCGAFCWFQRVRNGYCGHGCDVYRERVMFQPIDGKLRPFIHRSDEDYGYSSGQACGYGGTSGYSCGRRGGFGYDYGGRGPTQGGSAYGNTGYGYGGGGYAYGNGSYGYRGGGYGYGNGGDGYRGRGYGYGNGGDGYRGGGYGASRAGYDPAPVEQGYGAPAGNGGAPASGSYRSSQREPYEASAPRGERFIDRLRRFVYGPPRRDAYGDRGPAREGGAVPFERPANEAAPLKRFNGPKYPPNCTGKNC